MVCWEGDKVRLEFVCNVYCGVERMVHGKQKDDGVNVDDDIGVEGRGRGGGIGLIEALNNINLVI